MLDELISIISPLYGGTFIDCTFGQGGYSEKILENKNNKVIAIDRDADSIKLATKFSKTSAHFNHHPYDRHIKEIKRDLKKFAEIKWKNNYDMIFAILYKTNRKIKN